MSPRSPTLTFLSRFARRSQAHRPSQTMHRRQRTARSRGRGPPRTTRRRCSLSQRCWPRASSSSPAQEAAGVLARSRFIGGAANRCSTRVPRAGRCHGEDRARPCQMWRHTAGRMDVEGWRVANEHLTLDQGVPVRIPRANIPPEIDPTARRWLVTLPASTQVGQLARRQESSPRPYGVAPSSNVRAFPRVSRRRGPGSYAAALDGVG
jgi:hypothetical protein